MRHDLQELPLRLEAAPYNPNLAQPSKELTISQLRHRNR
jgi:hypothetical protein